jgi:hypothetical protein
LTELPPPPHAAAIIAATETAMSAAPGILKNF